MKSAATNETTSATMLDEIAVSATELATDFRLSDVEVAKLSRRGIIPRQRHPTDKRAHLYPYRECVRAYIAHLKGDELAAHQHLIEARSRQAQVKTRREELKLEVESGLMVRRDYILSTFETYLISYRQAILSRPSRLERRLVRARSREARLKILEEDAHATLASLAEVLQSGGAGQNGNSPEKKAS